MNKINDNGKDREMTPKEQADYEAWVAVAKKEQAALERQIEAQAAAKESAKAKLAALGLTKDEVNAIIGGI